MGKIHEKVKALGEKIEQGNVQEEDFQFLVDFHNPSHFWTNVFFHDSLKGLVEKFRDQEKPNRRNILETLERVRNSITEGDRREFFDFLKVEFFRAQPSFPSKNDLLLLKGLVEQYSQNPEFYRSLGELYLIQGKFEESFEACKEACRLEPYQDRLDAPKEILMDCVVEYFRYEMDQGHFEKVEVIVKDARTLLSKSMLDESRSVRLDGLLSVVESQKFTKNYTEKTVKHFLEKERVRLIEILGIFTALIAFILSMVGNATSLNHSELTVFMTSVAGVLMVFASAIAILFTEGKYVRKSVALIVGFAILIVPHYFFS